MKRKALFKPSLCLVVLLMAFVVPTAIADDGNLHSGLVNIVRSIQGDVKVVAVFPDGEKGFAALREALESEPPPGRVKTFAYTPPMRRPIDTLASSFLGYEVTLSLANMFRTMVEIVAKEKGTYDSEHAYPVSVIERVSATLVKTIVEAVRTKEIFRYTFEMSDGSPRFAAIFEVTAKKPSDEEILSELESELEKEGLTKEERRKGGQVADKTDKRDGPSNVDRQLTALQGIQERFKKTAELLDDPELQRIMNDFHRVLEEAASPE